MSQFIYYSLLSFYYKLYAEQLDHQHIIEKLFKPHNNCQDLLLSSSNQYSNNTLHALYKYLSIAFSNPMKNANDGNSPSSNIELDQEACIPAEEGEENDVDDDTYDDFDTETRCNCFAILSEEDGWSCSNCRVSCPGCNRSLTKDSDEYCTRCYYKCYKHGLIAKVAAGDGRCPKCTC